MPEITLANVRDFVGQSLGSSHWIDVDVERAKGESPFGSTIAHGYLSLSLVAALAMDLGLAPKDASAVVNYGLDKVRFITPVKAGERVRLQLALVSIEPKESGQFVIKGKATLEIENNQAPALVAET